MSRIRSIHPGLWTDEAFMSLSAHARLLFIGIWNEAFDDGVFEWKPLTLKARLFPADNVDVPALLEELVASQCIRQGDADGQKVGLVRNFQHFQRPKKPNSSGLLRPEWGTYVGSAAQSSEPVPNQSATSGEMSPQMEEGGGRMKGEDENPPPEEGAGRARDLFDEAWNVFPQHPQSNRAEARRLFEKKPIKVQQQIVEAVRRYRTWFEAEQVARGRSFDEGERYAPPLGKWIESGGWQQVSELKIKGELDPDLAVIAEGTPEFAALQTHRGKPIMVGQSGKITVKRSELDKALKAVRAA